jgi:hypothetical protein
VLIMDGGVNQQVINVHDDIRDTVYNPLHKSLEADWAAEQTHRACVPLPHAWHCKSGAQPV